MPVWEARCARGDSAPGAAAGVSIGPAGARGAQSNPPGLQDPGGAERSPRTSGPQVLRAIPGLQDPRGSKQSQDFRTPGHWESNDILSGHKMLPALSLNAASFIPESCHRLTAPDNSEAMEKEYRKPGAPPREALAVLAQVAVSVSG